MRADGVRSVEMVGGSMSPIAARKAREFFGIEQPVPLGGRTILTETIRRNHMSEHTSAASRITAAAAQKIIEGGIAHAEANGGAFTIAVVDDSGVLKALTRMDGAPLLSIQVAQDKAYTAVGFGMPSGGWYDFIKDDGPLATGAPSGIDRLVVFAGGFPITIDGAIVGAVGVSGGHYTHDADVALAGLAAIGITES